MLKVIFILITYNVKIIKSEKEIKDQIYFLTLQCEDKCRRLKVDILKNIMKRLLDDDNSSLKNNNLLSYFNCDLETINCNDEENFYTELCLFLNKYMKLMKMNECEILDKLKKLKKDCYWRFLAKLDDFIIKLVRKILFDYKYPKISIKIKDLEYLIIEREISECFKITWENLKMNELIQRIVNLKKRLVKCDKSRKTSSTSHLKKYNFKSKVDNRFINLNKYKLYFLNKRNKMTVCNDQDREVYFPVFIKKIKRHLLFKIKEYNNFIKELNLTDEKSQSKRDQIINLIKDNMKFVESLKDENDTREFKGVMFNIVERLKMLEEVDKFINSINNESNDNYSSESEDDNNQFI
ncbi:hypothetical protein A0H76_1870 [Hepatospora eriocheir]|uniref:Uncharacterized protein n=1 Tax=Hepatospora eriocheir TaxID=1081669 RepID=A0A1X0QGB6_9MICR|nr:hypothetical protein A0H76_1870 [Hepatospora eriocheir]